MYFDLDYMCSSSTLVVNSTLGSRRRTLCKDEKSRSSSLRLNNLHLNKLAVLDVVEQIYQNVDQGPEMLDARLESHYEIRGHGDRAGT